MTTDSRQFRNTPAALAAGGYTHAVLDGAYVFLAGQVPSDRADGKASLGDIEAETRDTMDLLGAALAEFGLTHADLVRTNIYMTNLDDFDAMNAIYRTYFAEDRMPARTTVEVSRLVGGSHIEIDGIARVR
jgi:2-iminobutanoate/2-iminopropanoate deaminase